MERRGEEEEIGVTFNHSCCFPSGLYSSLFPSSSFQERAHAAFLFKRNLFVRFCFPTFSFEFVSGSCSVILSARKQPEKKKKVVASAARKSHGSSISYTQTYTRVQNHLKKNINCPSCQDKEKNGEIGFIFATEFKMGTECVFKSSNRINNVEYQMILTHTHAFIEKCAL